MKNAQSPKILRVEDLAPRLTLGQLVEAVQVNLNVDDVVYFKNKNKVLLQRWVRGHLYSR